MYVILFFMRVKAVIHLKNFKENMESIRARAGKERLICVPVKADAYGHGALEIAKASIEAGAYCLGVAAVSEAAVLRNGGINAPVMIFSQPHPDEIPEIISGNLIPFISDAEFASALNEQAAEKKIKLQVHLKIDTGMRRIGCNADESKVIASHISSCHWLELAGVATHLAVSDSTDKQDIDFTKQQLHKFRKAVDAIKAAGINPGIVHAANSGAVILYPDSFFDMIRPGILLYGYKAADESDIDKSVSPELNNYKPVIVKPVMELTSEVTLIKKIKKCDSVSYGRTWTAQKDTYIGILSAGYADGLPRSAGNKWQVQINGKTYPVIGRVTMDQCCIDLGPEPSVNRWDEAVIFGGSAPDASELASVTGTIPYEITCNVNKRVPRVYV